MDLLVGAMSERRKHVIFAIVALNALLSSIDANIVVVALPSMLADLKTNLSWLGWVITGYMLATTVVMPLVGRIADDFGRKRVFMGATLIFTLSSFACALAPSIQWLIFFRILQGLAAGSFMPSGTAIISDLYKAKRAKMIGLVAAVIPIGGVLGPNVGGWLVQQFSWRAMFYINLPIGIAVLLLAYWLLRESPRLKSSKLDIRGATMLSGTILSFMYALTRLGESETRFGDILVWIGLLAGSTFMLGFVRQETRVEDPILDLVLLRWKPFAAMNALNFLLGACTYSIFSLVPTYAIMAYGMTTWQSGALLTPRSLGMITMAVFTSFLLSRLGYGLPLLAGMMLIGLSALLLGLGYHNPTFLGLTVDDFVLLSVATALNGLGMGLMSPAANNASLELMPQRVGAIAGLRGMFRQTGGVVGTSVVILVMSLYDDKIVGLQTVFIGVAVLIIALTPLVLAIPRQKGLPRENLVPR